MARRKKTEIAKRCEDWTREDGIAESVKEFLVGEVVDRLPMVLLSIVHGYADDGDPLERALTAALSPCAKVNLNVRQEEDGVKFHHYSCRLRTLQDLVVVPELWALAASKEHFADKRKRSRRLIDFLWDVEWKWKELSLEVVDEAVERNTQTRKRWVPRSTVW